MKQKGQDKEMPNRQSNMEQAEGSRESVMSDQESFRHGSDSEMMRGKSDQGAGDDRGNRATGITNRSLDREHEEQSHLPDRGSAKTES